VFEDADINLAARAAWFGTTINRGQTCIAARRAVVQRSVYQSFADALKPLLAGAAPRPLAIAAQAEQADRLVNDALSHGASLLEGETPREPNGDASRYPPTIVVDAEPDMAICQEASFAPLLSVLPFDTPEEALRIDAQCPYALGAAVFTAMPERAQQLAPHLRAGMVTVNDVVVPTAHPATPFGGRARSGWGVTQGAEGLLEMTVPQVVSVRGGKSRPHYGASTGSPPMTADGFRGLLEWGHAPTFGQRMRGFFRMIRGARGKT
jgi:acyl-CoA reductase-like NAD-dependent aldehyde dehydrogenase